MNKRSPPSSTCLPPDSLDILMKEWESLRAEVSMRLQVAFSHVAYIGAIFAFAVPAAALSPNLFVSYAPLALATIAVLALSWIATLNMRWVQHCGVRLKSIEEQVNAHFGVTVLGWENYAAKNCARSWLLIPLPPKRTTDVR